MYTKCGMVGKVKDYQRRLGGCRVVKTQGMGSEFVGLKTQWQKRLVI